MYVMRQRRLCGALCLMSLLLLSSIYQVSAQERRALNGTSLKDHFARGVYWKLELAEGGYDVNPAGGRIKGPKYWQGLDDMMKMLANDFNINLIWDSDSEDMKDVVKASEIAEKYGIKLIACTGPFYGVSCGRCGFTSGDTIKDAAREEVNALGGKSAFGGYVLQDEPAPCLAKQMEIFRRALKEADPTRDSIVVTMNKDTDTYAHRTGFPILCVDCYPFGGDRSSSIPNPAPASQGYYRAVVGGLAKEAQKTGKWLWVMPQVYADFQGPWWYDENKQVVVEPGAHRQWRMPTIEETRWQLWEGIRSGCKGEVIFALGPGHGSTWDGKGAVPEAMAEAAAYAKDIKWPVANKQVRTGKGMTLLYSDGTPTPQMIEAGKTFAVLAGMEKLLLSLEPADFPASFAQGPFFSTATFAGSLSPSSRYIVVVNDNLNQPEREQVFFLPHTKQVKDIVTGKILPLREETADNMLSASLELEPGSGAVLEVEFAKGEPGLILFDEDFSLPVMAVGTKNIVRTPVAPPWGLPWKWIVESEVGLPPHPKGALTIGNMSNLGGPTGGVLHSGAQLDVYMYIEGNLGAAESLIVEWVDNDGKRGWLRSNNYNLPIPMPRDIKEVEMQLAHGTSVSRILLWAVPQQK